MTCTYDPVPHIESAMHHCPECGAMVVGGFPHPDYDIELTDTDHAIIQGLACKWYPGYRGEDSAGHVDR